MKTLRHLSVLLVLVCSTLLIKAQCGIEAGFYQDLNPNQVPWFHDTTHVNSGWQITNQYWSFGDGGTSTLTNPTHVFPHPGTYTVCHYVQASDNNGNNCIDTICKSMQFYCTGVVQAAISAGVQNNLVVYTGTGSSNYPPLTYLWIFPGGSPSASTTPVTTVQYQNPGAYQACLTVTDSNGCSTTVCQTVNITNASVCANIDANFTTTLAGQAGTTLYMNSTSTGTTTNTLYQWKIDNVIATNPNPNTGYVATNLAVGTHTVCLYVYGNANTLCDSICKTVNVTGCNVNLNSYFYISSTSNTVNFTGSYAQPGQQTLWVFGDGATSTDTSRTVVHTFPANNNNVTYTVCHYISIPNTTCADTSCFTVTIAGTPCGQVNFTSSQNNGITTLNATSSVGGPQAYNWKIKNGQGAIVLTGSGSTFSLASLPQGTYEACVFLYNNSQTFCDSFCNNVTVSNFVCPANLNAGFQYTSNGNVVTFSGSYNPANQQVIWDFGDGTLSTDTPQVITHTYPPSANAITYNVCHYVYINNTVCRDTFCQAVVVPGTLIPCGGAQANFTYTLNGTTLSVNAGTGYPSGTWFQWSINGQYSGTTPTYQAFSFNNLSAGTHQVCLYIKGSQGTVFCDSVCQLITVAPPCGTVNFTSTQNNGVVVFTATSSGVNNQYVWAIRDMNGNGVQTGSGNPFTAATLPNGTYNVCVYMYSSNQALCDSTCQTIAVTNPTTCTASISDTTNPNGVHTLTAHYNGLNVTSYLWSTGATTPTITTTAPGNYCVTVTGGNNCSASACYTITANCGMVAFNSVQTGEHLVLTATSTTIGNNFVWAIRNSNGQGVQTGSGNPFTSMALTNGTYHVCVYMYSSNQQLCDSACETITVTNINPCTGLNAEWTPSYVNGNGVHFIPVGNPSGTVRSWTFGDGSSSTNADPTHYYLNNGLYNVCHIVSIPGTLCADTFCYSIQASAGNPCSGFAVNINHTVNSNGVHRLQAVATGTGSPFTYLWSTGATTQVIETTSPNVYCVTVYNASQCSASDCDTVATNTPSCNASYAYTYVNCNTVQFANASTGGYTNQVWQFGDGTSSSAANPVHSFPAGTWTVQLTVYSNGTNCQSSYYQVITVHPCGVYDTICGVVFNDANGNGVQDNGEQGLGGGTIHAGNYTATVNANGEYHVVLPTGTYTVYYCAPTGYSFTIPMGTQNPNSNTTNCASYTIATSGGHHCGYNFGVQNNSVNICGVVYLDANNNQQRENTEPGIANTHITLASNNGLTYHAYTNQNGEYCVTVPEGTYVITAITNIGGVVIPQSISLVTVNGGAYNHNDFGVYQQPGACNLSVTITPHTTVTPGFAAWYDVRVCNVGASVSSGTVNLFYDPTLIFGSSSPAQTSVNTSTHTISWALNNLAPGGCASYWVTFTAATNTQIGQHVFMLANVTTTNCNEVDFTNNVDTTHQDATASWDPNNKLVLPAGEGEEGIIKGAEELTYTINFQNTGTAPAVNVVLRDLIDTDLDLETFRMLGGSHPYTVQFEGREAIWKFNAIMLPDSNTNETESHGHVSFAIKPLAGLAEGTKLNNTADIYFDYNEAITTNTTVNTIDYKLGLEEMNGQVTITLMPNPFKDYTTIRIEGENSTYELRIFDMLGQQVQRENTTNNVFIIERGTLAGGIYMYEVLKNNKVIGKGKMIAAE